MSTAQVLVVDDDVRHAASVRELLCAHGYSVEFEIEGAKGLRRIKSDPIDVLILDLDMPNMSGMDVLQAIGSDNNGLKTIVVSGESHVEKITPILRLGAYDYLPKPYEPEQLLASVRNALTRTRLERENRAMLDEKEATNRRDAFLVDASPDLIYMLDPAGRFTFLNAKLRDVFGYDRDALLGRDWTALVSPDLRQQLRHHLDERRTGQRATQHFEFEYRDPRGAQHIIELSAMGLYDGTRPKSDEFVGTYGILRDVTESRRTARALAQSQQKFHALFMNSPDAVFISRLADGHLIEANDNFARMMEEFGSVQNKTDLSVWGDPAQRTLFVEGLGRSPRRHQMMLERELLGSRRYLDITGRTLDIDNEACLIASVKDVTSQKQSEQDRLNLETQLQQASKMEAIGQLAGGIAHDFNNILASIIGYTELSLSSRAADPAQVQGYLREVIAAGQRARDLISQMLTFTRARRGTPMVIKVSDSIAEVSRMLRAAIPKTIHMETSAAPDEPAVEIDPVQLQQVVLNLLINARDAISGNGRIDVCVGRVVGHGRCASCDAVLDGDFVEIAVADTGHGISEELLPRIFDMFVSTRAPGSGTGIGLWLIHTLVHEYEGHVTVDTSPRGTTFRVLLPVQPTQRADDATTRADALPEGRILVVDDEVSVGNFIGEVLRNAGYQTLVFNDSAAAFEHIGAHHRDLALILTDQSMPQVSGLELAELACSLAEPPPVVIITGYADKADKGRIDALGVKLVLSKPFRIDDLLDAVRNTARSVSPAMSSR
jgi:PAS domain S-box-containing protein